MIDEDKITLDESIIKRLHKNRFYREVVSFVSYDKKMKENDENVTGFKKWQLSASVTL